MKCIVVSLDGCCEPRGGAAGGTCRPHAGSEAQPVEFGADGNRPPVRSARPRPQKPHTTLHPPLHSVKSSSATRMSPWEGPKKPRSSQYAARRLWFGGGAGRAGGGGRGEWLSAGAGASAAGPGNERAPRSRRPAGCDWVARGEHVREVAAGGGGVLPAATAGGHPAVRKGCRGSGHSTRSRHLHAPKPSRGAHRHSSAGAAGTATSHP